jgi:hypothetical protein
MCGLLTDREGLAGVDGAFISTLAEEPKSEEMLSLQELLLSSVHVK